MSEHGRRSDELIVELAERLKAHTDRYDRDQVSAAQREKEKEEHTGRWRNGFTERLQKIDTTIETIKGEMNSILWVKRFFIVLGGGAVVAAGKYAFEWFAAHFK